MTAKSNTAPVELFADWEITSRGDFRSKSTGKVLSRTDWEIEMSYEFYDNDEALQFARVLSAQAADASKD